MKNWLQSFSEQSNKGKLLAVSAIIVGGIFVYLIFNAILGNRGMDQYAQSAIQADKGMTLWQVIQSGGWVMVLLGVLSIFLVCLVSYLFLTLKESVVAPEAVSREMINNIREKKYTAVRDAQVSGSNVVAKIARAGLEKREHSIHAAREYSEIVAKKEVVLLWQNVNYLTEISAVAPMIGLLGTVIGMIQAFNTIAFNSSVVKPVMLAGGVSKAMVTTGGGLIIAIAAMFFYSYFRARLQTLTALLEVYTSDIIAAYSQPDVKTTSAGARKAFVND